MSLNYKTGPGDKDLVIIASKEDHAAPSTVELPELEPAPGLILPNGDINWNCPCLGGMATGPCGVPFREAFSCFHYSDAEPKGSDCYDAFSAMQECMIKYPTLYNKESNNDEEDAMKFDKLGEHGASNNATSSSKPATSNAEQSIAAETKSDKS